MERISRFRAILLLILFISILALFAVKLFDLQIIETNGKIHHRYHRPCRPW